MHPTTRARLPYTTGIVVGIGALVWGFYYVVIPLAAALRAQRIQAVQQESGVAWEDLGDWRCYWLITDPLHKVCVPPGGR